MPGAAPLDADDLLDRPGVLVMDASGERCYDVEGVEATRPRPARPIAGRTLSFSDGEPQPRGSGS